MASGRNFFFKFLQVCTAFNLADQISFIVSLIKNKWKGHDSISKNHGERRISHFVNFSWRFFLFYFYFVCIKYYIRFLTIFSTYLLKFCINPHGLVYFFFKLKRRREKKRGGGRRGKSDK